MDRFSRTIAEIDSQAHSISIPALKLEQPIGPIFIATIDFDKLIDITYFDVRRIYGEKRDLETYLGIQRPLLDKRVKELNVYVNTIDACFPTAVILSIPDKCANYDETNNTLTLSNYIVDEIEECINYREIAKVIDGQHRIEGLKSYEGSKFQVNVSIFIDIDVSTEAYIFSTVNLAQTKVNKSLVYDLYDLAKSKSPQKLCHNIAVTLNGEKNSPFYRKIKRLGVATDKNKPSSITQAAFVESLLKHISSNPMKDRDIYMRHKKPIMPDEIESKKYIFRKMMIEDKDF